MSYVHLKLIIMSWMQKSCAANEGWKQRVVSDVNCWLNVTCLLLMSLLLVVLCCFQWKSYRWIEDYMVSYWNCWKIVWRLFQSWEIHLMTLFWVKQFMTCGWAKRNDLTTFSKAKELFNDPLPRSTVHDQWLSREKWLWRPFLRQKNYLMTLFQVQ